MSTILTKINILSMVLPTTYYRIRNNWHFDAELKRVGGFFNTMCIAQQEQMVEYYATKPQ